MFVKPNRTHVGIASLLANTLFVSGVSLTLTTVVRRAVHAEDGSPQERNRRYGLALRLAAAMIVLSLVIVWGVGLRWEFSFLGIHSQAALTSDDAPEGGRS